MITIMITRVRRQWGPGDGCDTGSVGKVGRLPLNFPPACRVSRESSIACPYAVTSR